MTVNEFLGELRQLNPDYDMTVTVDGCTEVELSIVYIGGYKFLNIGRKTAEEEWP